MSKTAALIGPTEAVLACLLEGSSNTAGTEAMAIFLGLVHETAGRRIADRYEDAPPTNEMRDVIFARLRRLLMQRFGDQTASRRVLAASDALHWLMGAIHSIDILEHFSTALTQVIARQASTHPERDFSFAGKTDFIPLSEVLQLLGGGKHRGVLVLERESETLDIYFENSVVTFLNPHQLSRRVLPARSGAPYREISNPLANKAEREYGISNKPMVVTLHEEGLIKSEEIRSLAFMLGCDTLFDFLREDAALAYRYYRLSDLPEFALEHGIFSPVTPILLEINKRLDDWHGLLRAFPDPDQPVIPADDMMQQIGGLSLSVMDLKILQYVQNGHSARTLGSKIGLPLHEVYHYLVRFAREGLVEVHCSAGTFADQILTLSEDASAVGASRTVASAEHESLSSALDSVLGDDDEPGSLRPSNRLRFQ